MAAEILGRGGCLAVFCSITAVIFLKINLQQDEPYMDEIFHVPQARNYCYGYFEHWNNKITTLPGLYLSSQLILRVASLLTNDDFIQICDTFMLRLTNVLFTFGCFFIFYTILNGFHASEKENVDQSYGVQWRIFLKALNLTLFPLLYFFSFLYYTDVGSTFFVLLGFYFSTQKQHLLAAATGAVAMVFRQTNIVWVGFYAAISILSFIKQTRCFNGNFLHDVLEAIKNCFVHFVSIVKIGFPYGLTFIGFIIFVIKNNGIVVGDRSSHEASVNIPQLFYYSAFTIGFSSFLMVRFVRRIAVRKLMHGFTWKTFVFSVFILFLMLLCVHHFTYVHKYLLSDNRHYPFYIWRRIYDRHWLVKYLLVPGYFLCWNIILNELAENQHPIWILVYVLCTAAVLVPQKLLEFRYFIIPYLLFQLHMKLSSYFELLVECVVYCVVNGITIYLFLYRPFMWDSEEVFQRFMW